MNIEKIKGLPENIKALRKTKGFTQEQMSEELDISYSHYTKIESGDVQPSWELLLRISDYFNVPFDFVVKNSGWRKSADYANLVMLTELQKMSNEESELLGDILSYIYLKLRNEKDKNES